MSTDVDVMANIDMAWLAVDATLYD